MQSTNEMSSSRMLEVRWGLPKDRWLRPRFKEIWLLQFANPQDKWNAYSAALATKGLNTAEHEKANGQLWTDALSPADRDYIMHRSNATPPPVQNPNALPKAPKPGTPIPTDPVARKDFLKKFMTASGNDPKKAIQLMQEQGYDTAPVAPAAK